MPPPPPPLRHLTHSCLQVTEVKVTNVALRKSLGPLALLENASLSDAALAGLVAALTMAFASGELSLDALLELVPTL